MPRNKSRTVIIRTATASDLPAIVSLSSGMDHRTPAVIPNKHRQHGSELRERLLDGCVLSAEREGEIIAAAGIDLENGVLSVLVFTNPATANALFAKLVVQAERLAACFGMRRLDVAVTPAVDKWFAWLGYTPGPGAMGQSPSARKRQRIHFSRSLLRRQTRFARQIRAIGEQLGIPDDYGRRHRLALQNEASQLSSIGPDVFGREQFLAPNCAAAWFGMRAAAFEAGAELQAVSAFRSVGYQRELLQKKLDKGLTMLEILLVSAAPGYSEHHSGYALDISTPGFAPLQEEFENSPAFTWLQKHAGTFGFRLSFPQGNRHKLAYEPWHWCYAGKS
ncbi:MAG TPA: M15 family metallopeptidase [Xanthomonadales bacterium]|nr:M15 family metallopeptidase [Xanthomonadales bacterium]